jgi:hypothetical protein
MAGKFELKKSGAGQFYFNLKAANGEVILTSEQYVAKASAQNGIESVKKNAPDNGRYERKTAANDKHFFVLKGGNGEVIGKSGMYANADNMEKGIDSVKAHAPAGTIDDQTK